MLVVSTSEEIENKTTTKKIRLSISNDQLPTNIDNGCVEVDDTVTEERLNELAHND